MEEYSKEMLEKIFPVGVIIAKTDTPPGDFNWVEIIVGGNAYLQRKGGSYNGGSVTPNKGRHD